jgi:hypothetical protein
VKRKRTNPARKLKLGGTKPQTRRKKSSALKRKAASVSKKKGTGMATVRRYKKKVRRNAKRRVTAKQRAAARKNIKKAQAANRKKGKKVRKKATRKKAARTNPRRTKRSPRRAAKTRSKTKRARRTVRTMKRRVNPAKGKKKAGKKKGLTSYQRLQKRATKAGVKATGSYGVLEARVAQAEGLSPKSTAAKRRRKKKGGRKRVAGKRAAWSYSNRKRKVPVRGKKRRRSTSKAKVARAYLGAKRVQSGIARGKIGGDAAKMAKAMGLTRVNPVGLKTMWKDLKTVAPMVGLTVGGMVGMLALGMKASAKLTTMEWTAKLPEPIKTNIVPLTTATVTLGSVAIIKKVKALAKLQKYTMPILIGGLSAAALHAMITTKWGKDLMAKLGISIGIDTATLAEAAASGSAAAADGLGSYMTVSQYMGAVDISPIGPSWYGRGDMSPMGDFVDAGPQNMFGQYEASDFPVHSPGPGDNINVMAQLGGYDDDYGQEGVFASGYGAAHPEGGYGELELEETPGGTVISGVGEAGIFGGKGVI